MPLQTFQVIFDRASATYAAGETVTGKIELSIDRPKVVRGMHVEVKGKGRVYSRSETYLILYFDILGTQTRNSRIEITAGHHEYRFSYQLPKNIPNTFQDSYACIVYTMKVVINRPWKFNHVHKSTFTVISPLDLTHYSAHAVAIDENDCVDLYSFYCFYEGALFLNIKVPTSGYIPGQTICTTINYENISRSVKMTRIKAQLKQEVVYHTHLPHNNFVMREYLVKSTKLYAPFPKEGQAVLDLLIPYAPPSYIEYCNIIDVAYKLHVIINFAGQRSCIHKSYPIIMGTMDVSQWTDVPLTFPVLVKNEIVAAADARRSYHRDHNCFF